MLSESEFAQKIKTKHPEYSKIPDAILVQKIIEKHPEYKDQVETSFIGRLAGATQDVSPDVASKSAVLAQGKQDGELAPSFKDKAFGAVIPQVTGNKVLDVAMSPVTGPLKLAETIVTAPGEAVKETGLEVASGLKNTGGGLIEQGQEALRADPNEEVLGEGFSKAWNGLVQTMSAPLVGTAKTLPGGDKFMEAVGKVFNAPASALGFVYEKALEEQGLDPTKPEFQMAKQQLMDAVNVGLMAKSPEIAKGTSKALSAVDQGFTKGIYWLEDTLAKKKVSPELKTTATKIVTNNVKGLDKLENSYKPVRNFIQDAQSKGIDVKEMVAQSDLLLNSIDDTGTIRTTQTGGAVDQISKAMEPADGVIAKNLDVEAKAIPFTDVEAYIKQQVENGDFVGTGLDKALSAVDTELKGLGRYVDADGNIPLSDLHKLKIFKGKTINYSDPTIGLTDKTITRSLKELIEQNTDSVDVKAINRELQTLYMVKDFLSLLDGKKVSGGKLGKYFAQTVGTIVGSSLGPVGAIMGGELAKYIQGKQMQGTFKGTTGAEIKLSEQMQSAIDQSSKNDGSLKTNQSTTISPVKNPIPKSVQQNQSNVKSVAESVVENKVTGNASAELLSRLKSKYKEASSPEQVLDGVDVANSEMSKIWEELSTSESGKRIFNEDGVTGVSSTFPSWIPENLRSSDLFSKVFEYIDPDSPKFPTKKQSRLQELVNVIYDELDSRTGVDTSTIRKQLSDIYSK